MYMVFVFSSRTFEKEEVCEMISEQERMKFFLRSAKLPSEYAVHGTTLTLSVRRTCTGL